MRVAESSDPELVALRKLAEEMAVTRRERPTTAHLLAAIAHRASPAAELLRERRLDSETLARLARASTENERDPIGHAMRRAAEIARSAAAREPGAIHLLVALVGQRKCGAFRALEQCGTDMARLRAAAIQIASGVVEPRRTSTHELQALGTTGAVRPSATSSRPGLRASSPGIVVPVVPPIGGHAPAGVRRNTPSPIAEAALPEDAPSPAILAPSAPAAIPQVPTQKPRATPRRKGARGVDRFELEARDFPVLTSVGVNLTLAAAQGQVDPIVGREVEIDQTLDILAKRRANNPCLVGPAGVGKTSVVRGLAARIASAQEVRSLDDLIIVELAAPRLLSTARGSLAEKLGAICKEMRENRRPIVLFFDDLCQLMAGDLGQDLGGEFRLALANGDLRIVATATSEEYRRCVESDSALASCFTLLDIDEPNHDSATGMVAASSSALKRHHGIEISADALAKAVAWSVRYLPGRALPDKALSVVDLACARSRRRGRTDLAVEAVAEVVAEMADMPAERLLETDRDRMLSLEKLLGDRVVGHEAALKRIALILRRNAAGLRGRRPIGSFLLLGPTGVGKTETAKAIAEALFHSADAMTRLDLSEFAEPHSLARLIGSPPGYVGHEAGGQLTEAVRRRPYQVVLLDEIEKAHRDVLEAFLQVLDEGRMTDGRGRTVDMTNTVIVLTSNLGSGEAAEVMRSRNIGFSRRASTTNQDVEEAVVKAARDALPPELYNRIDEVIGYSPLSRGDVCEVARRLLNALSRQLQTARKLTLTFDDQAIESLLEQGGYDPALGARPMKRTIARLVEAPIAELVLREQVSEGGTVRLTRGNRGELQIDSA